MDATCSLAVATYKYNLKIQGSHVYQEHFLVKPCHALENMETHTTHSM